MKRLFLLLALLCFALTARAQQYGQNLSANLTAASGPLCNVANSCLWMRLPTNATSVTLTITGTWAGTVTVEAAGSGRWFILTTSTSNIASTYSVPGDTDFRVRVSAYTSGTVAANLVLTAGPAAAGVSSFGTPPRTGAVTTQSGDYSLSQITGSATLAPNQNVEYVSTNCGTALSNCYAVKGDVRVTADCATTNTSPIVTSATAAFTSADVGKLLFCINRSTGAAVQRGTVLSVQSATSLTSSANSTASATGATLEIGTDDAPNFKAAYTAAIAANWGISIPCGVFLLDSDAPVFDSTSANYYSENLSISGCSSGGTNSTVFVLGPGLLDSAGDLVVKMPLDYPDGPFPLWTHGSSFGVSNLQITGLSYLSSAAYNVIETMRGFNLKIYDTNSSGGCYDIGAFSNYPGEQNYMRLNIQTTNGGLIGHNCNGVYIAESTNPITSAAQGDNIVSDSVFAYISGFGVQCLTNGSGFACDLRNDYMLNVGGSSPYTDMVQCLNTSVCNIDGGYYGFVTPATQPFADFSGDNTSVINMDNVIVSQGSVSSFVFNGTGTQIKVRNSIFRGLTAASVFSTNLPTFFNEGGNSLSALPTTNVPTYIVTPSEAGTGTCSANAATITFKGTYLAAPLVTLSPTTSGSTGDQVTAASTTTATVHCNGATDGFNFTVTPNPF